MQRILARRLAGLVAICSALATVVALAPPATAATCVAADSIPSRGETRLRYLRPISATSDEYEVKATVRWDIQAQIDCFATPGSRIDWAFEQSNRYQSSNSFDPKMSEPVAYNYPLDSGVYFDTNSLDAGGVGTGVSYGVIKPQVLKAGVDYTVTYKAQLPAVLSGSFYFSIVGQVVEKNCNEPWAWCTGAVGWPWGGQGFDTKAEAVLVGSGPDRPWTARSTSCWAWVRGQSPSPCAATGGGVSTPRPPNMLPRASFSYSRLDGALGRVRLDASASSDPDGNIAKYEWIAGGRVFATGKAVSWSFGTNRYPSVSLRVTDSGGIGGVGTDTTTKTLSLPNRPPESLAPSPGDGSIVGSNRPTLSATAWDPDGDPLTYSYHITGYMVDKSADLLSGAWTVPSSTLDPGQPYNWTVTVRDPYGGSAVAGRRLTVAMLPTASDVVPTPSGNGYWQVASDGGVFSYGDAQFYGSVPGIPLRLQNIIGMARTPTGMGYWIVGSDGGVFSFGDAQFHGSLPGLNIRVNNIVGMVPTKTGRGYWLAGADGGVFSFGDAQFYGSMGGKPLNAPVEGISATRSGNGYWLVARDGGVFSFGDAPFYGSMGGQRLNYPMVDMDVTPDGGGYWLTAEDGGVFTFGNARFYGSMGGRPLNGRVTGMAATPTGNGYWLNACDGGVFTFGDAPFFGANSTYMCRGTYQP